MYKITTPKIFSPQKFKMDSQWLIVYFPLTLALYILTKHFLHKLRNLPPSPVLNFPFIGHLYLLKKPLYHSLAKISDRYGPVVLLQFGSRRVLHVSSPSVAEECLNKNDIAFANRPRMMLAGKYMGHNYTNVAWAPYGDHWRNLRKISSLEILSMHRLQMLHGIRADEVKSMICRLSREAEEQRSVNMKAVFFEVTLNVMMRMIAGKRYYGENLEDAEEAKKFREMTLKLFQSSSETNWGDFLPVARWLEGGLEKQFIELEKQKDEFMHKLIKECKTRIRSSGRDSAPTGKKIQTMIEVLLESQEQQPEYYHDELIRSFMLTLLIAGSDTTAGTLEWALTLLLNNPNVLKKAQLEIDICIGNERLVDESDIEKLPYLRGIIYETLRMYPIGPLLIPHESSEPCTVKGYNVPAGTMLFVNAWAIQNDPKNWEDPTKFKPERFEGQEGKQDPFKLMPFGYGRRGCPGEGLAMRMLGAGLGSVVQCFDWERVGKDLVDMSTGSGLTIAKSQPLMAYCKARPVVAKILS